MRFPVFALGGHMFPHQIHPNPTTGLGIYNLMELPNPKMGGGKMNVSKAAALGLMKNSPRGIARISLILLFVALSCWTASTAWAQHADHRLVQPSDLKWVEMPALPKGATAAVIEGRWTRRFLLRSVSKSRPTSQSPLTRIRGLSG